MSFERKNLTYSVKNAADKLYELIHTFTHTDGSAIVYVRSRRRAKELAQELCNAGLSATFYHAGLEHEVKDQRQRDWQGDRTRIIVATNAFGMGIDKPDVRLVIHMDLPDSIEAYFQEAGRAGRDLKPSEAFLLVSPADIQKLKDNLEQSFPELERIKLIYNALGNYLNIPVGTGENASHPFVISDFANRYGFSLIEVFHTLKILEKEGFFVLSDSFDEPSKVMIKTSRDDIYGFQVNNPQFSDLIKFMLRSLPGVMTDFVKINEETMASKIGTTPEKVIAQLKKLESYHFLSYAPRNDKPQVLFLSEFVDTRHFGLSKENYYDRKKDAEERVKAVIDFVNNDEECRSVQLLRYFNEKTKKTCGRCDVCLRQGNNRVPYATIEERVESLMGESALPIKDVLAQCAEYGEEQVLDAVRFLVDNGVLQLGKDGTVRKDNKKSRQ